MKTLNLAFFAHLFSVTYKRKKSTSSIYSQLLTPSSNGRRPRPSRDFPSQLKSVLAVGEVAIHLCFPKIGSPNGPKPLKKQGIFVVGLGRCFLSHLSHNNSLNPVGFDSVFRPSDPHPNGASSLFPYSLFPVP